MFFLQVFFYICLWIVEVFSRSDVSGKTTRNLQKTTFPFMKQQIIFPILILNFLISFSQEKYVYEFEKIEAIDTIQKKEILNDLLSNARLFDNKFFISYNGNEKIPTFYKKEKDFCLSFNLGFSDETSYNIIGLSENQQFIYIDGEGEHSTGQTNYGYKNLYIVNLKKNTYLEIQYYSSIVFWEPDEDDSNGNITKKNTVNSSKIVLNKNGFTAINNIFSITNDEKIYYDVIQSGEYELDEFKLKKTKYYDAELMKFEPIKYVGNIAIGMTLEDLKLIYPYISLIEKENIYQTCADENTLGFEVWDGTELLGYVDKNITDNKIKNLKVISPRFNFDKFNTNTTASEILKYFPKSNVRLDLLTDWEHIDIKELNIEFVFKTNDTNRIGKYKNENFVKLKNGKTKVDFIQVY